MHVTILCYITKSLKCAGRLAFHLGLLGASSGAARMAGVAGVESCCFGSADSIPTSSSEDSCDDSGDALNHDEFLVTVLSPLGAVTMLPFFDVTFSGLGS